MSTSLRSLLPLLHRLLLASPSSAIITMFAITLKAHLVKPVQSYLKILNYVCGRLFPNKVTLTVSKMSAWTSL